MAYLNNADILQQLKTDTRTCLAQAEELQQYTAAQLRQRPAADSWSAVEVLHHLNYYAQYYLQAMESAMEHTADTTKQQYHPGWLGNYFTRIIGPRDEQGQLPMSMPSPPDAVPPAPAGLDPQAELNAYLTHQQQLLLLLDQARHKDLGRIRVPITLTRFIRLKLGDTFRFVVAHQLRHHQQIAAALVVVEAVAG
ncbi:MAG: DinB family protein [Bacteroidota bacterium]